MNWHPIGPHRYHFEDDLLYWQPNGALTVEHLRSLCAVFDGLLTRYGYVLYIADARCSSPMGYDTRRQYVQWLDKNRPRLAVVGYGSPSEARATAVLIGNAARLRGSGEVAVHSVASEAEARVIIEAERARFHREMATATGSG